MARIKETTVYAFDELSEKAKNKAIEKLYDINVDYEWDEYTIDEFKSILEKIGFSHTKINYSGFSSQGDGLSFTGYYSYNKGSLKAIIEEFPLWIELHKIVKNIQDIQRKNFYRIEGNIVRKNNYYCHENTVAFCTENQYLHSDIDKEIECEFRSLMKEFYSNLEKEYDYLTSEEAIIETIEANEYEFDAEGNMA